MPPTATDDPCRLFRPRPFPERLWAFLCALASGLANRLKQDAGGRATPPPEAVSLGNPLSVVREGGF